MKDGDAQAAGPLKLTRQRMLQAALGAVTLAAAPGRLPLPRPDTAQARKAGKIVFPWLVPDDPASAASFQHYAQLMTQLSPAWYSLGPDLAITSQASESVMEFAADHGVPLHPLIKNQNFDPHVAQTILGSGSRRADAAERVAQLVLENGFDGINIDFEGPFGSNRDQFSDFVNRVAQHLRPAGKWTTVDVVGQIRPGSAFAHKPSHWAEPYDYPVLGQVSDAVMIMAYDYTVETPGAISPLWWFRDVLRFAQTQIPPNKLVMGVPLYGRHWILQGTKVVQVHGLRQQEALDLLASSGARLERPAQDASPRFSWHDTQGSHVVHFEDEQSLVAKLNAVSAAGVAGIALWRLGQEKGTQWDVVTRWPSQGRHPSSLPDETLSYGGVGDDNQRRAERIGRGR